MSIWKTATIGALQRPLLTPIDTASDQAFLFCVEEDEDRPGGGAPHLY
jgi:hypothetical protein